MIQELRAVAILVEDHGSVPSTHILAHNHLKLHFSTGTQVMYIYKQRQNTYIYKIKISPQKHLINK